MTRRIHEAGKRIGFLGCSPAIARGCDGSGDLDFVTSYVKPPDVLMQEVVCQGLDCKTEALFVPASHPGPFYCSVKCENSRRLPSGTK